MTLTQAKDQIAQEYGFETWRKFIIAQPALSVTMPDVIDKLSKLYATEKVKEALKLAAEQAEAYLSESLMTSQRYTANIDKHSILSLETELVNNIINEI